jgi:hypothetical protein
MTPRYRPAFFNPFLIYYDRPDEIIDKMANKGLGLTLVQRAWVRECLDLDPTYGDPVLAITCVCFGKSVAHMYCFDDPEEEIESETRWDGPAVIMDPCPVRQPIFEGTKPVVSLIDFLPDSYWNQFFRARNSCYMLADALEWYPPILQCVSRPFPGDFDLPTLLACAMEYGIPLSDAGQAHWAEICRQGRPSTEAFRPLSNWEEWRRRRDFIEKGWSTETAERIREGLRRMGLPLRDARTGLPECDVKPDVPDNPESKAVRRSTVEKRPPHRPKKKDEGYETAMWNVEREILNLGGDYSSQAVYDRLEKACPGMVESPDYLATVRERHIYRAKTAANAFMEEYLTKNALQLAGNKGEAKRSAELCTKRNYWLAYLEGGHDGNWSFLEAKLTTALASLRKR